MQATIRHLLYDRLPSAETFAAVAYCDSTAEARLASEIGQVADIVTLPMLTFYRQRIETWLRLVGLETCQELAGMPNPTVPLDMLPL